MCGIVAYIGKKNGTPYLLKGLTLLEYRGYDSVGIGTFQNQKSKLYKTSGSVTKFKQNFGSQFEELEILSGLGHTRWATHGAPTALNAHPHVSYSDRLLLVHNGIVENYGALKNKLQEHHITQQSQTDTEIFANYLDFQWKGQAAENHTVLSQILQDIKGSFAVALLDKMNPDNLFLFRKKSPLIIGKDNDNNIYAASDVNALNGFVTSVALVPDNTIVIATRQGKIDVYQIGNQESVTIEFKKFTSPDYSLDLGGYEHFMLKEIEEQPFILSALTQEYVDIQTQQIHNTLFKPATLEKFKTAQSVCLLGCGTSFHAAKFGEYVFEQIPNLSVFSESGGEYKYRNLHVNKNTIYIFISQSGETADLIGPLEQIKQAGAYTLAICNVINSTLAQIADDVCYMKAGPEISVASTKAFTAQLLLLYFIAQKINQLRGNTDTDFKDFVEKANDIHQAMDGVFSQKKQIQKIAQEQIATQQIVLFIGRNLNYPIALEGALKLKEISYKNCDGMQMGELKHGPLALIDEHAVTIACESRLDIYDKYVSNIREVLSRNGKVISIVPDHFPPIQEPHVTQLSYPHQHAIINAILNVLILQLLSYYSALSLGVNIDKPRNLAKSVTVE